MSLHCISIFRAHQALPQFPYHPAMAGMAGMANLFYQDALSTGK